MHPPTRMPAGAFAAALAGAALMLMLQAAPAATAALEYQRSLLTGQPWRLLTAHLVHINWTHALVNAGAWLVLARLFERELGAGAQLLCLLTAGVFISLALALLFPGIAWYRGASGALHALFFAGATAMLIDALRARATPSVLLALALVVGGWVKVALELPQGSQTAFAAWLGAETVPQAHLLGAAWGTALGLLGAYRPRRRDVSA